MATWYVRPSGGSYGAADGTSYATPFDGFSSIDWTASGVQPGDTLYVCGEHREKLIIGGSGTSSDLIIIRGDYSGDAGSINGSALKANASWTMTSAQTYTYEQAHTLGAALSMMLWRNDTRLTQQSSIATVEANAGSFWHDTGANIIYVHPPGDVSPISDGAVYEVPSITHCIEYNQKNYVQVISVECKKTYGDNTTYGGVKMDGTGNSYINSSSHNHRRHCFQILSPAENCYGDNLNLYDSVVSFAASIYRQAHASTTRHCEIRNSAIHDNPGGHVVLHGSSTTQRVETSGIVGCDLYNTTSPGGTVNTIESYDSDYCYIRGSKLRGYIVANGVLLSLGHTARFEITGNVFDWTSQNTSYDGIMASATPNMIVCNNIFKGDNNRASVRYYNASTNGRVWNNIFYGVDAAITVDATSQTGFTSNNNCGYTLNTRWGTWGASTYATLALWQAASSMDANSITTSPAFTDYAGGDYTLTSASPCKETGGKWWSGSPNPMDYNNEPIADLNVDMGIFNNPDGAFLPVNL